VQRRQRIGLEGALREVIVLYITLQQALPLQVSADVPSQAVDQLRELLARRCRDSVETQAPIGTLGVDVVEEQHVTNGQDNRFGRPTSPVGWRTRMCAIKVNFEIQRASKTLH
jgi:hypothetical protein